MSLHMPERLYQLLPALYRLRDVEQGEPLRALLGVIEGELERIEGDTPACTTTGSSKPAPNG